MREQSSGGSWKSDGMGSFDANRHARTVTQGGSTVTDKWRECGKFDLIALQLHGHDNISEMNSTLASK